MVKFKRRLNLAVIVKPQQLFGVKVKSRPRSYACMSSGQIIKDRARAFFVAIGGHRAPWACDTPTRVGSGSRRLARHGDRIGRRHVSTRAIDLRAVDPQRGRPSIMRSASLAACKSARGQTFGKYGHRVGCPDFRGLEGWYLAHTHSAT